MFYFYTCTAIMVKSLASCLPLNGNRAYMPHFRCQVHISRGWRWTHSNAIRGDRPIPLSWPDLAILYGIHGAWTLAKMGHDRLVHAVYNIQYTWSCV